MSRMPVLFIGHGNPMNAIEDNAYTRTLARLGVELPRPRAILCVSAHWMSEGTWITHQERPRTIHDFYGFPPELFEVQYPAHGSPAIAERIMQGVQDPKINGDRELWGLDHGTWAILRHLYPDADIPVLQLSVYMERGGDYHFHLGTQLRQFRDQGILIIGSGNIVHNLRRMNWEEGARPFDWAVEFDEQVKDAILRRDILWLARNYDESAAGRLSVPSPDHYYPLLYAVGAADEEDKIRFEYESIDNSSISMRCVSWGRD